MPFNVNMDFGGDMIARAGISGAQNIMQGAQQFGQGLMYGADKVAGGMKDMAITKEKLDMLDAQAQGLAKRGKMSAEELNKFMGSSVGAKTGTIADLLAQDSLDQKLKLAAASRAARGSVNDPNKIIYNKGEPGMIDPATGLWTSRASGGPAATTPPQIMALKDPESGKLIGYWDQTNKKRIPLPKNAGGNPYFEAPTAEGEAASQPALNITMPAGVAPEEGDMSHIAADGFTLTRVQPSAPLGVTPEQARAELERRRKGAK